MVKIIIKYGKIFIICMIVVIIAIFIVVFYNCETANKDESKKENDAPMEFFPIETFPFLNSILSKHDLIVNEIKNINNSTHWKKWPEKYLYSGTWKIFPFFAFGTWSNKNCNMCPNLYNFIKNIPGLKVAILSKLGPGVNLQPHRGWKSLSNYILRCHYGLIIPENCYVKVRDKKKYHKEKEWIIFDDSLEHMAENQSDSDRTVLIIDIDRPKSIPVGTSTVADSAEFSDLVNYFKYENSP